MAPHDAGRPADRPARPRSGRPDRLGRHRQPDPTRHAQPDRNADADAERQRRPTQPDPHRRTERHLDGPTDTCSVQHGSEQDRRHARTDRYAHPDPDTDPERDAAARPEQPYRRGRRPAHGPAASTATVTPTSALIALLVLLGVGAALYGLTRRRLEDEAPRTVSPDVPPATEDEVIALMTVAGEALIDAGFDVNDVQSDLRRIAAAHQVTDAEVLAMPTFVVVSAQRGRGVSTAAVRAGQTQLQLYQIEALDEVISRARLGLAPRTAIRRLREIHAAPPPFGPIVRVLGGVLATVGLAVLLGSSWRGLIISGLLGLLTGVLVLLGTRIPSRYQALVTVVAATMVSLIVFLLARAGLDNDIAPCLIAPLIPLLPGALLTTGMIELATGQMISGAGRLAAGFTQLLLLGVGIAGAALLVGVPQLELTSPQLPLGAIGPWLAVAAFGVGITVNRCVQPRSMGWVLLVLYVAYGAQVLGGLVVGGVLSAFVGAFAMTPVADLVARQRGGPPAIVSFTPAFWLLVPGALGLMGVASLLSGDQAGRDSVLTTVVTMVGIALGVLVGRAVSVLIGLRRDQLE